MKKESIFLAYVFLICILFIKPINSAEQGVLNIQILGENECMINFDRGWNFFSFCKNLNDNNSSVVFSQIEDKYRYVMRWNPVKQEFDIFSPKSAKSPIPDLNDNKSYFIYLYNQDNLEVEGYTSVNELRDLVKGWNAPGYQLEFSTPINLLIALIRDDCRYIMKWSSGKQEFDIFSPKSTENPFNSIESTEGFFIYSRSKSFLII